MEFKDILKEIVAEIADELQPKLNQLDEDINTIRFEHGKYREIEQIIGSSDRVRSEYKKIFPLVALLEDTEYNITNGLTKVQNGTILICYSTKKEYQSEDRYEINIKPILSPIYKAVIEKLENNEFVMEYKVTHRRIDRPMASNAQSNAAIFSRDVDCIEISNLSLTLYPENNC